MRGTSINKQRKDWILKNLTDKNHIFNIERITLLNPSLKPKKSKSKQNLLKLLNKLLGDLDSFSAQLEIYGFFIKDKVFSDTSILSEYHDFKIFLLNFKEFLNV